MQPEGSLLRSQVPATCPYPEPARSSPYLHIPLLEDPSWYYLPIYTWVFQVVSFPQVSPPKPCIHLFPLPYMLHALSISCFSSWLPRTILGEDYRSLSSSLCSFIHSPATSSLLGPNIYPPQHPILKHPQPLSLWLTKFHTHTKQQERL